MNNLNQTPMGNRIHIGIFGKTNSGKSTLLNALTGQDIAVVADYAGTTTDPVYKTMELLPLGPIVWIDTAGIDDLSSIGDLRIQKTNEIMDKVDIAIIMKKDDEKKDDYLEQYLQRFTQKKIPFILVENTSDDKKVCEPLDKIKQDSWITINAKTGKGIASLKKVIIEKGKQLDENPLLVGDMVQKGDYVLLVAPQDIQAPKGRLILPQVQVIRELLDYKCIVTIVTTDQLDLAVKQGIKLPDLVVTDSQVFDIVNKKIPASVRLTSFSVLMARAKGNIQVLIEGAKTIADLKETDKVLIAEACTHHALKGDIAREKLPQWLKDYVGSDLKVDVVSGAKLPESIKEYKLIIHCGACMLNRKLMQTKIDYALNQNISITNFGTAIAFLKGILERVSY